MTNKEGNKLALIVAYYLARFNSLALTRLGYDSFSQAFRQAAAILDVKKNYIKLSRDEFDPAFTWRRGWIRPMSRQIERIIELFENIEEPEMTAIIRELLSAKSPERQEELSQIIPLLDPPKEKKVFLYYEGLLEKKPKSIL